MVIESGLNEISTIIGELRSFVAQQVITNGRMLEELKKISDRTVQYAEMNATFLEYRKTLHARFDKIHDQMTQFDMLLERMEEKIAALHRARATARGDNLQLKLQIKSFMAAVAVVLSILTTVLSGWATSLFHIAAGGK